MKVITKINLMAAVLALSSTFAVLADGPVRKDSFLSGFIVDANGNPLDAPDDLVYDADPCDPNQPNVLNQVFKPDGQPLTFGEYNRASGRISVKCANKGTHVVIEAAGLVPNGVYSIWLLTFESPGFTPDFAHLIGEGSLGAPDGTENTFTASDKGKAVVSVFQPAGSLSEFGQVTGCLFEEFQFMVAAVYHPNRQT